MNAVLAVWHSVCVDRDRNGPAARNPFGEAGMIRLKKILFPTDFSECSRRAREYACALAERFQAELHVLHVLQDVLPYTTDGGAMLALPPNYLAEHKQAAEDALKRVLSAEWTQGKAVIRVIRPGNPFLEISKYAKEMDIDVIVIGTHGRTALLHMLLGSVAEKVIRKSPCPVLTVHPEGHQ